jgi:hypothetical protein
MTISDSFAFAYAQTLPHLCLVRAMPAQAGKEQAYKRIGDGKIGFLHTSSTAIRAHTAHNSIQSESASASIPMVWSPKLDSLYLVSLTRNNMDRTTWIGFLIGEVVGTQGTQETQA